MFEPGGRILVVRQPRTDGSRMASSARTILAASMLAVVVAAVTGVGRTDATGAATRGQALFGMNVPSLAALDEAESAVGARAAIVGTFADWAHAPDFPRELAEAVNDRGAVPLVSWEPWDSWRG